MAFRKPQKKPEFADLKGILAQSKETENPLYQTVQEIIERLSLFQKILDEQIAGIYTFISERFATKFATFLTKEDESRPLPNSFQILAGPGIILDYSIPNKLTISSTGGGAAGYYEPLTDGDPVETELVFVDGECIMVFVPTP